MIDPKIIDIQILKAQLRFKVECLRSYVVAFMNDDAGRGLVEGCDEIMAASMGGKSHLIPRIANRLIGLGIDIDVKRRTSKLSINERLGEIHDKSILIVEALKRKRAIT